MLILISTFPNNPESFGNSVLIYGPINLFNKSGLYDYQCDPHAGIGMVGTITVHSSRQLFLSDTLQSVFGCDSIISLDLTINSRHVEDTSVLASCDSLEWNGIYIVQLEFTRYFTDINGCDSILTLDLTINSSFVGDTSVLALCDSLEWNGTVYNTTGVYVDTLQSASGCDSILTLDLTIVVLLVILLIQFHVIV